jgi:N-acetylglucosamine kinase-like BadF-type ATPase
LFALAEPGPALALIAGTGAICVARTRDGDQHRAGGLGPVLGDEGSAHGLVLDAVRAALRFADGRGPETALTARLRRAANVEADDARSLASALRALGEEPSRLAALAPLVLEVAAAGDAVAAQLVERTVDELGSLVEAATARAFPEATELQVLLSGSFALHLARRDDALIERLGRSGRRITLRPIDEPVRGALELARALAPSD